MHKIRKNIFETNSSSTHSVSFSRRHWPIKNMHQSVGISLSPPDFLYPLFMNEESNKIKVPIRTFGWEWEDFFDQFTKLQYLVTMVYDINKDGISSLEELYETKDFIMLNDVISNYCNCDGIEIDSKFEVYHLSDGRPYIVEEDWKGIDHQSYEYYKCLQDFLDDWDVSIEEFVFCDNICLRTGNDNEGDPDW